jgi:hypothetical protein
LQTYVVLAPFCTLIPPAAQFAPALSLVTVMP